MECHFFISEDVELEGWLGVRYTTMNFMHDYHMQLLLEKYKMPILIGLSHLRIIHIANTLNVMETLFGYFTEINHDYALG